jgi:hypothetical protein
MPVNGHTSGVSVLGSDKKRAEQREPRRRMRDGLCMRNEFRFARDGKGQQRGGCCGQCREILLIKTRFRERLNRRSSPLMGCCATSLIRTASGSHAFGPAYLSQYTEPPAIERSPKKAPRRLQDKRDPAKTSPD